MISNKETDHESLKHVCKFCNKSFLCGRSLGIHMRSHVINSTNHHHDRRKLSSFSNNGGLMNNNIADTNAASNSNDSCYELRKDPQKTPKSKDSSKMENSSCLIVLDKLCKECGKGFQSWKALFGHMKCHSNKVSVNKKNNTGSLDQDSWTSQSDDENLGGRNDRIKRSRSRNRSSKRYTVTATTTDSSSISMSANNNQITSNNASTSVVSEIDQEQEAEIAMCLMMLSRDVGKWGEDFESSGYCNSSVMVNFEGKKLVRDGSKMKKLAETQVGVHFLGRAEVGCKRFEKIMIKSHEFSDRIESNFGEFENSSKRKFECATCNKSFHSYQALGGHKASHKKLKGCFDSKIQNKNYVQGKPMLDHEQTVNGYAQEPSDDHPKSSSVNLDVDCLKKTVMLGAHECPICLKMFSSGQALGGHKRSHLIAEAKLNQQHNMKVIHKHVCEIRGFPDLNMPPEEEEEMIMSSSTSEDKSWHWEGSSDHHNHEATLPSLLSTS